MTSKTKERRCPHCGSRRIDVGATGLHACEDCGGVFRDRKHRDVRSVEERRQLVGGAVQQLLDAAVVYGDEVVAVSAVPQSDGALGGYWEIVMTLEVPRE